MQVEPGKKYRIAKYDMYFFNKYGTGRPIIEIEGEHKKVFGGQWWGSFKGHPASIIYAIRTMKNPPKTAGLDEESVFYGKINGLGELVHIDELEEVSDGEG